MLCVFPLVGIIITSIIMFFLQRRAALVRTEQWRSDSGTSSGPQSGILLDEVSEKRKVEVESRNEGMTMRVLALFLFTV